MAPQGLSSNWKQLQAKIKAESTSAPSSSTTSKPPTSSSLKRKATSSEANSTHPAKKFHKDHPKPKPRPQIQSHPKSTKSKHSKQMGNTQSSILSPTDNAIPPTSSRSKGVTPSLSLWASENDISPEDLAEAYQLGATGKAGSMLLTDQPPRPNEGLAPGISLEKAKYLALDCEMVGIGEGGYDSALARVSIVDFHGRQVYDSFVRPKEKVTNWRTEVSGVSAKNMPTARSFEEVQSEVAKLLNGRILVGHDVRHDLAALKLEHEPKFIRDTAKFMPFKKEYGNGLRPALRVLAKEILGVEIQSGQHSSIEDARVTMLLFRKHKAAFDVDHANRYPNQAPRKLKGKQTSKFKKKK